MASATAFTSGLVRGDSTNDLISFVADPNVSIQESKALTGNIRAGASLMPKGFFTDTTVCIGCKACEVACKQWNQLPDDGFNFTGMSYDNTGSVGASTWRHVSFIERPVPLGGQTAGNFSWLMMSDVCKHCARAGCLDAVLPAPSFAPNSIRSSCSLTSAMAAAIA